MATRPDPAALMRLATNHLEQALAIADSLSEHLVAALVAESLAQAQVRVRALSDRPSDL